MAFYTRKLGFLVKKDIPFEDARWLTLISPQDPDGPELILEPNAEYPTMKSRKEALLSDGIPFNASEVDDVDAEFRKLRELDVGFTQEPTEAAGEKYAIFNDTCGNLIQIYQSNA